MAKALLQAMQNADALSRLSLDVKTALSVCVLGLLCVLAENSTGNCQKQSFAALEADKFNDWPTTVKQFPPLVQPYRTYQKELSVKDGLLLKGQQIVIPGTLSGSI